MKFVFKPESGKELFGMNFRQIKQKIQLKNIQFFNFNTDNTAQ